MQGYSDPFDFRNKSIAELSKGYSKERSVMAKRYNRLKAQGFDTNFTRWVESMGGKIPTVKQLKAGGETEQEIKNILIYYSSELKIQKMDKQTLVSVQKEERREAVELMRSHGYDISESDYNDYVKYMEWMRAAGLDMQLYSETGVQKVKQANGDKKKPDRTQDEIDKIMKYFKLWQQNGGYLTEQQRVELKKGGV